ncbi:uncharacterized protein LOC125435569 [Sphaerodactylus townsendi]|uniref:uncharacterized protein LOC125435569 n=1 Tax=Sphaerodactylus townsendi TaxID=933632 RepID=UPI002025C2D0|nr:uncharacterized protein LOC125435569 [Sphaerodactylus townsendi]
MGPFADISAISKILKLDPENRQRPPGWGKGGGRRAGGPGLSPLRAQPRPRTHRARGPLQPGQETGEPETDPHSFSHHTLLKAARDVTTRSDPGGVARGRPSLCAKSERRAGSEGREATPTSTLAGVHTDTRSVKRFRDSEARVIYSTLGFLRKSARKTEKTFKRKQELKKWRAELVKKRANLLKEKDIIEESLEEIEREKNKCLLELGNIHFKIKAIEREELRSLEQMEPFHTAAASTTELNTSLDEDATQISMTQMRTTGSDGDADMHEVQSLPSGGSQSSTEVLLHRI